MTHSSNTNGKSTPERDKLQRRLTAFLYVVASVGLAATIGLILIALVLLVIWLGQVAL